MIRNTNVAIGRVSCGVVSMFTFVAHPITIDSLRCTFQFRWASIPKTPKLIARKLSTFHLHLLNKSGVTSVVTFHG